MDLRNIEEEVMDLERRVVQVEQILPTLLTRNDFDTAMVAFSTEIRRHFDVVAESLGSKIQLLAEGHAYLVDRLDGVDRRLDGMDRRLDGIDLRLDGIDRRLDGIDLRLDGIDRRLDGIDARLDGIDRRLDRIDPPTRH